jgi:FdhD protein
MSDGQKHLPLQRLTLEGSNIKQEIIVEETAIQLNGLDERGELFTHATLLATPIDLVELHAGHLVSEGYVEKIDSRDLFRVRNDGSIYVDFQGRVYSPRRERIVTSSCGACNHPDLSIEVPIKTSKESYFSDLDLLEICNALNSLTTSMKLFKVSGGSHGSGLYTISGDLEFVSEDIGRHNAVDKTIGKCVLNGEAKFAETMLLLSGRCGWDIVAKAARAGIPAISSLGAFSSAAVQLAREQNITLYGFVGKEGAWKVGY